MIDYNWVNFQNEPLLNRFPDRALGYSAWQTLAIEIERLGAQGESPPLPDYTSAFGTFLVAASRVRQQPNYGQRPCRLFVSHRNGVPDADHAERIAYLATTNGHGYWLDVHDPVLRYANKNRMQITPPAYDVLIAAIIEMALLNCTCVLAVMTQNAGGSKWIPYEFGRAKDHWPISESASIWLAPRMHVKDCGEYVHLGAINRSETAIEQWIAKRIAAMRCSAPSHTAWGSRAVPRELPS